MTSSSSRLRFWGSQSAAVLLFMTLGVGFAWVLVARDASFTSRWQIGALVLVSIIGLQLVSIRASVTAFVVYCAFVGTIRRIVPDDGGSIDPLLVVVPLAAVTMGLTALARGGLDNQSTRSRLVLALGLLAVLGIANPLQGSILVGGIGLAFFGLQMLWFFVGRTLLSDHDYLKIMQAAAIAALISGTYGVLQSRGVFLARDRAVLEMPGGAGGFLDGELRPIGTMASTGEFARFSMVCGLIWLASAIAKDGSRRYWAVAPFVFLTVATVYAGVRVSLITALVTCALFLGARTRLRPLPKLALVAGASAGVIGVLQFAAAAPIDDAILDRQLTGLTDPLGPNSPSVWARIRLAERTLVELPTYPLGRGTGLTTPVGQRVGGTSITTETDVGDVAASWGILGLLLYASFIVISMRAAYVTASRRRDRVSFVALGVVGVGLSQWINGGLYAVAPLVWLSLGWIDAAAQSHTMSAEVAASVAMVEEDAAPPGQLSKAIGR